MADQAEAAATTANATTAPADPTLVEKLEKDLIMVDDAQHGTGHAAPAVFGMDATVWVSVAMLIFIGILVWKKVPALIGGALDKKIAEIREQLDEAKELRVEAEKLKAKYDARMKAADHEAELIIEHANKEAADVVAQAKTDAKDLVARRKKMAEDKISAAERSAISDLRAKAASAATTAAEALIASKHDATADKGMVDGAIADLSKAN